MTKLELIPSISYSQHDIIRWIIKLHLGGLSIECDPCFGNGNFYKPDDINAPYYCSDISPSETTKWVSERDCCNLTFSNNAIHSIMFDPPFLQTTGKGSIIKDRFGSYPSMKELWEFYAKALWEFGRVLRPNGVLIVKMQNTVMSGKQWWSVNYIKNLASEYGFDLIDEFILLAKHRMPQHNLKQQRHARKYHSFFLVFRK